MKKISLGLVLLLAFACSAFAQGEEKTLNVLCIGNSFTFFHDSNLRLEEIAASQGHSLKTKACTVGGYTFQRHLKNDDTMGTICYNTFDICFLQDQSRTPAVYARDPKAGRLIAQDAMELAERIRCYSPGIKVFLEHTWAYSDGNYGGFGTMDIFDTLLRAGTQSIANKLKADVSPIGEAFAIVRAERKDIDLYDKDKKHQSALGTYLKSCINYLLIYREPFTDNATNCGYDAKKCEYLRKVAERVVLFKEKGIK